MWMDPIIGNTLIRGISVVLGSYALGCIATGYYLVRFFTREDIRQHASGSIGAKNVGRRLGTFGFVATFLADFAKGALAVWCARRLTGSEPLEAVALCGVLCGHLWPIQLGFRGGKGMATSAAGLLVFDPIIFFIMAAVCLAGLALLRRTVMPALFSYAIAPVASVAQLQPLAHTAGIFAVSILVLISHRANLAEEIAAISSDRKLKTDSRNLPSQSL
ncbi:MAG: glycerol-3-phosphate acyltransferase [Verrucomicrobia bacterium]|nr:glycerol-3-phosphate acyltransferase [Verrucomicrobiota bacterium]